MSRKASIRKQPPPTTGFLHRALVPPLFDTETEVIKYAAMVDDERFSHLVKQYRSDTARWPRQSNMRRDFDTLCRENGIRDDEFVGQLAAAAYRYGVDAANIYASIAHPEVVKASIEQAKKPQGVADREMHFKHMGYIPAPKGQVINVNAQAGVQVEAGGSGMPAFEDRTLKLAKVIRADVAFEPADGDGA